jgi:hypothetical protein
MGLLFWPSKGSLLMGVNVVANAQPGNQPNPSSFQKPASPVGRLNSKTRPAHPAPAPNQPQLTQPPKAGQAGSGGQTAK